MSYVFVSDLEPEGIDFNKWYDFCEEKVVVTVMDSEINETIVDRLTSGFGGAMKDGFVLDWGQQAACGACETLGGKCGYKNADEDYLCFCSDGSTRINDTCNAMAPVNEKGMSFIRFIFNLNLKGLWL